MIRVEVKNNISLPKLKFQEDLLKIADEIFIPTLRHNIDSEQDLTEKAYPPLAKKTIEIKRKQGLSTKILTATAKLRNSFISRKLGKSAVVVTLNNTRKDIGDILQNQGVRSKQYGLRFFNFFGISTRMEREALKYMENKIAEAIKNA